MCCFHIVSLVHEQVAGVSAYCVSFLSFVSCCESIFLYYKYVIVYTGNFFVGFMVFFFAFSFFAGHVEILDFFDCWLLFMPFVTAIRFGHRLLIIGNNR